MTLRSFLKRILKHDSGFMINDEAPDFAKRNRGLLYLFINPACPVVSYALLLGESLARRMKFRFHFAGLIWLRLRLPHFRSILQSFKQMSGLNFAGVGQISDGSSDFDDSMISTR